MVGPGLAGGRISATGVKTGLETAMRGFDNGFVFALHTIQTRSGTAIYPIRLPDVPDERHARQVHRQRSYNIDRQAPRIKVEHQVGKEPVVVRRDALTKV